MEVEIKPMQQESFLVFVYGTLKQGQPNHCLMEESRLLDAEATASGLRLHATPRFPMAIKGNGRVHGELYQIDQATLHRLDHLEGHPTFYERVRWQLDRPEVTAWIYLCPEAIRYPLIESGMWPENRSGAHRHS